MGRSQNRKNTNLIADLKRRIAILEKAPAHTPSKGIHLERKEVLLAILALLPAIASYFVDDWYAFAFFIVLSWLSVLAICAVHVGRLRGRMLLCFIATLVYGGVLYRSKIEEMKSYQEDVYRNLSVEMQTPYLARYPIQVFFTVRNGGATGIVRHRDTCIVNAMRDISNGGVNIPKGSVNPWSTSRIGPGGDAMSDECGLPFVLQEPFRCLDLTVKVEYALEIQPDIIKEKEWRFVAERRWGPHWFPYSTSNGSGNFCDGTEKY